ncbi:VanZ family protein [Vibrio sp. TRT 21S02]|uniref:VanZ family protein n=1 Tax=Vibrio sp. TRT 21S02 TaxID=3418507 RepID=UPI003CF5B330
MKKIHDLLCQYWVALSVLILLLITVLSLTPLPELPAVPGSDKSHHFIAYGALMFSVGLRKPKYWLFVGAFFVAWSGAIELIQPYVNRYGEWLDLAANVGGLTTGFVAGRLFSYLIARMDNSAH